MNDEHKRVHRGGRVRVGQDSFGLLRPSRTQVLLGYAVPDEQARAQAALDELVPNRACVVVAGHTDAQVEAAGRRLDLLHDGVRGHGTGLRQMQAVLDVWVLAVTELTAAEAARHPEGLVELAPGLRVVGRGMASVAQEPTVAPSAVSESPGPHLLEDSDPAVTALPESALTKGDGPTSAFAR